MKKFVALLLALTMLTALVPTAALGVSAEAAPAAEEYLGGTGTTLPPSGGSGVTNPAAGALDTEVDYCSILGISQATAKKFGAKIRESFRAYDFDVSLSGVKVNVNDTQRERNALGAMLEHEVFNYYDTFMFEVVTYQFYRDSANNITRLVFDEDDLLSRYTNYTNYLADLTAVHTIAEGLLEGIKGNSALTDIQKALLLHDRLAAWTRYDHDGYATDTCPDESYTIVGILWKQEGVCQGYSETYAYLLDQCGIESRMAHSAALNHIWNIVTIGGSEYYVDVTWDDPSEYDMYGQVLHDNFLVSLSKLRQNHVAYDYNTITNNTQYDNQFWTESRTEFQLIGKKDLYFLDNQVEEGARYAGLVRWTDQSLYRVLLMNVDSEMTWTWYNGGSWTDRNYACLDSWEGKLYFNTATSVYEYDPSTQLWNACFTPNKPNTYDCIYGFTIWNGRYQLNLLNNWPTSEATADAKRYYYDPKTISSVELVKKPSQVVYKVNTPYDFRGLTLRVNYTDGTSSLIKNALHSYNYQTTSTTGSKSVTVGLFSKEVSFTLRVVTGLSTPKVTVKNTDKGVSVSWGKVSYADTYILYRAYYSNGSWSDWAKVTVTSGTSYVNQSAKDGKVYRYAVRAYQGNLKSGLGQSGSIRRLKTPTVKVANAVSGTYLTWSKITGAKTYAVYRCYRKSGQWTDWKQVGTTSQTTYTDKKASANTTYRYAVKAVNGSHKSASGTTGELRRLTAATVTAKKSGGTIKLSWTKVAGAKYYAVYRRVAGTSTWTKLYTTKTRAYTDKTAKAGKYYEYAVRAVNGSAMSAYKACKKVKR